MCLKKQTKLLQGKELKNHAQKLGVSDHELYDSKGYPSEPELQRRVIEAERSIRESGLWKLALVSSIASVISAFAAWVAVYYLYAK